jgi:hypothetical protein
MNAATDGDFDGESAGESTSTMRNVDSSRRRTGEITMPTDKIEFDRHIASFVMQR